MTNSTGACLGGNYVFSGWCIIINQDHLAVHTPQFQLCSSAVTIYWSLASPPPHRTNPAKRPPRTPKLVNSRYPPSLFLPASHTYHHSIDSHRYHRYNVEAYGSSSHAIPVPRPLRSQGFRHLPRRLAHIWRPCRQEYVHPPPAEFVENPFPPAKALLLTITDLQRGPWTA